MKKITLLIALSVLFYSAPGYIMLSPSNASAQALAATKIAQAITDATGMPKPVDLSKDFASTSTNIQQIYSLGSEQQKNLLMQLERLKR